MTLAASLAQAAYLSYKQCDILNQATTLRTKFKAFIDAAQPIFDDNEVKSRSVGNWLVVLQKLYTDMDNVVEVDGIDPVATGIYRMCLLASKLSGFNSYITAAQATALLAAWNANIGT
jgi:hypothetical protein